MAAKLEKTSTPGIFRRHMKGCPHHGRPDRKGRCDCSYVIAFRDRGRQHTETFRTFAEAREAKRTRGSQVVRGEFSGLAKVTLRQYALEWIERYQGTGRRGFRDETRDEYRGLLSKYALRYFPPQTRLAEIDPRQIADFIGWLTRQPNRRKGTLSDKSVRNALGPLTACLATARREGVIRHNPATGAALPNRPQVVDDDERARPFPRLEQDGETVETMELTVALVHSTHRLMFELLAATGLRRSELLALRGGDLVLDGGRPFLRVRQRVRRQRGRGLVIGPLKSRHAKRELPVPVDLADRLRALRIPHTALVFSTATGGPLDPDNLADRVLGPACAEAGVEWAGFHTFRHTVASRLFEEGRNVVQVQRWLGHHSPSFTLDTYVHMLDADLGTPLGVNAGSTQRPETAANQGRMEAMEVAA